MQFGLINRCFLALFLVLVGGTVSSKCLDYCGVEFPDWLNIGRERSYLEGRTYESLPELTVESLTTSKFQDDFEQYASDLLPMKDSALLLNARLQRLGIETAAFLFGYEVYPTFFDSDYAYDSASDSIVQILSERSNEAVNLYRDAANAYVSFADQHEEFSICFYRVDRVSSSSSNPTYNLVGDSVDTDFLTVNFFDQLGDDVVVVDGTFDSFDEMLEEYFRTDHHWTIEAAYAAYLQVAEELNLEGASGRSYEYVSWDEVPFYGSLARSGLCLTDEPDTIADYWFDLSNYRVIADGEQLTGGILDHYYSYQDGQIASDIFTNRYAEYFHGDYGLIEIRNCDADNQGSLLMISDSFSNNMERLFAEHYSCVYVVDPRHYEGTIEDILSDTSIQDVLFLLGSTNMATDKMVTFLG